MACKENKGRRNYRLRKIEEIYQPNAYVDLVWMLTQTKQLWKDSKRSIAHIHTQTGKHEDCRCLVILVSVSLGMIMTLWLC